MSKYVIYEVMGKKVEFTNKDELVSGTCENVRRDIIESKIFFKIDGKEYVFVEPNKMEMNDERLVFVYGSEQEEDLIEFCGENYAVRWGEDVRKSIGREKNFLRIEFNLKQERTENE